MKFVKKYFSLFVILVLFVFMGVYLNKNLAIIMVTFNATMSNMTRYFFLAAILVAVSYYFTAKSYQVVFRMNRLPRSVRALYKLNLIGLAVNVIIPTAGLSQAVVYAEDARKRGESKSAAVNAVLVTYISDYTSISVFLIFSLIYLSFIHAVTPHVVIPAVLFLLLTLGSYVLSYFAGRESVRLERLIIFLANMFEKIVFFFTKKEREISSSVDALYKNFKDVNKAILDDPKDWFAAVGFACIQHIFAIMALFVIFYSLGLDPTVRALVAAYSVAEGIRIVSPTPSGIGFVEGSMYLVLTNLGVPGPIATTATIIYRGLIFWIPLATGFVLYQRSKIGDIIANR